LIRCARRSSDDRIVSCILATVLAVFAGHAPATESRTDTGACEVARRYIDAINQQRYADLGDFFAPEALFLPPTGETLNGREAIQAFYQQFLGNVRPSFRIGHVFGSDRECVVELEAEDRQRPGVYTLTALDHFIVDAQSLVTRLVVYLRPAACQALICAAKASD